MISSAWYLDSEEIKNMDLMVSFYSEFCSLLDYFFLVSASGLSVEVNYTVFMA